MYDRNGMQQRDIHTSSFVRELRQDLRGGRAITKANYRVLLEKDADKLKTGIAGIYPVETVKQMEPLILNLDRGRMGGGSDSHRGSRMPEIMSERACAPGTLKLPGSAPPARVQTC